MNANARLLRDHPFFSRLAARTLKHLTAHAHLVERAKGCVILHEGDRPDAVHVVLRGRCRSGRTENNGKSRTIAIHAPGDTFGARAVLSREAHRSTVSVLTDAQLLRLDAGDIHSLLARNERLAGRVVDRLLVQLRDPNPGHLGRVSTLISVTPGDRGEAVSAQLASALRRETGQLVLLLRVRAGAGRPSLQDCEPLRAGWNARPLFREWIARAPHGLRLLDLHVPAGAAPDTLVAGLIGHLAHFHRHVVTWIASDVPDAVTIEFLIQSDLAYALFRQAEQELCALNLLLRQVRRRTGGRIPAPVHPVLCLSDGERALDFDTLNDRIGAQVHGFIHGLPAGGPGEPGVHSQGRFSAHVRHLAREVGRCRIGLALSSGGAKSLAHIGVIQVLEENGIDVDVVAGASMGAYIGALWAYGLSSRRIEELALDLERPLAMLRLVDPVIPPRQGFIRGLRIRRLLERSIGDAHFSDLVRQLRVVATDLVTLERVVFQSGPVAGAVHASMAMPGLMVPVPVDGHTLMDGGASDPLPVDVLRDMGVERIIAVNTIPNPKDLRLRIEIEREQRQNGPPAHRARTGASRHMNYFAPGNILDVMARSMQGAQTRIAEGACGQADVVLRPVVSNGSWHDFSRAGAYIRIGREAATARIEELRTMAR